MRPTGPVTLEFPSDRDSPPRTSDDFEQVPYPPSHWSASHQQEELPLFSMNEEKARRRVPKPAGAPFADQDRDFYDDEGKDVYNKPRAFKAYQSSGRPRYPPIPPPTSIVSCATYHARTARL